MYLLYKIYWNIIYILYLINKLIEFPLIFFIHNILIFIYIKINKKKKITKTLFLLTIIPIISLIIKKIIKNNIFIYRPYKYILNKKYIKKYLIPNWIIKHWIEKKDSSFPSGHTIYSSFWIIIYFKKRKNKLIKKINFILILIIISRILLFLHNIIDIIFSIIINIFIKNIIYKYIKNKKIFKF